MNGTISRMLCSTCRILLIGLTAGLGLFAMGVLIEPQGMRQTALAMLMRLIPSVAVRG